MAKANGCSKCERYSFGLRRCKDGKVNPRSKKQTKDVMAFMGYGYVCNRNRYKSALMNEVGSFTYAGGLI